MKLTRYFYFIIFGASILFGRELQIATDTPVILGEKIVDHSNTLRSFNSRTDTTTIFIDDMEGGTDDWSLDSGWVETNSSYSSPTTSMNFDDDNYGLISGMVSPVISLPELTENELIQFSFDVWCDFPDADGDGDNYLEDYYYVDVANLDDVPTYFHVSSDDAYDGTSWWCADPAINGYENGWLQFLDTPSISIPASGGSLTAQMKWGIEDPSGASVGGTCTNGWDAANVRISTDDGATWELLNGDDAYDFTDGYGWIFNDPDYYDCEDLAAGWGGQQDWHLVTFDLGSYASEDVIIRFGFGSDPGWATPDEAAIDGLRIDDIEVTDGSGNVLYEDDGSDDSDMTPTNGFDTNWDLAFYDYGADSRPGGSNVGWATYMPGDNFNGSLDLSDHAGSDIKMRVRARVDEDDDGGNGEGLHIDDFHIWKVSLEETIPQVSGVYAEAGDGNITVTWNDLNVGSGGDVAYDDGQFDQNESIIMSAGTSVCGTLFDMPYGATSVTVNSVSVFGATSSGTTNLYGYPVAAGIPDETATHSTTITTTADQWTEVTLDWDFAGDFIIGYEITDAIACVIDSDVPGDQAHSWTNLGGWQDWSNIANNYGLSDGEWGIRANVDVDGGTAEYNVYRSAAGGDYSVLFNSQGLDEAEYIDNLVQNDTEYCYKVSAVYSDTEGTLSSASCATPEAQTIHPITYDDGEAETSTNVGSGNFMSVKFTPVKYPSELKTAHFYVPTTSPGLAALRVWDDDGTDGMPGTELTPSSGVIMQLAQGWNIKDISSLGIQVSSGDVYIGWEETSNTPPIGIDLSDPDYRSYINVEGSPPAGTDGEWALLYVDGDFMVRAEVDSGALSIDDEYSNVIPENFVLRQNYPNPFNPVTNISFEIPEFSKAHLAIFDLTGREVLTLIDNANMNTGRYQYQLNASELPSGMYFYRLVAVSESGENYSDTKKLILLK